MNKRDREKRDSRQNEAKQWAKESRGGELTHIRPPDGVKVVFRYDKVGAHEWDFLSYKVGTKYPTINGKKKKPGDIAFQVPYKSHGLETPSGYRSFVCNHHFGKKCAVCDWIKKNSPPKDVIDKIKGKDRNLWLVNPDPANTKKPEVFIFDAGYWNRGVGFGELMSDACDDVDESIFPFDLDGGCTASVRVKEVPRGEGATYKAATRIAFKPRKTVYSEKLLDTFPCLDECLIPHDYKTVWSYLDGTNVEEDDDDADDDIEEEDEEEEVASKKSSKKPSKKKDEDDDDEDEEDTDDEEDGDEEEDEDEDTDDEDEPPVKKKPAKKTSKKKDEDEDDEDEDEDDEEPVKPKKKAPAKKPAKKKDEDDDDEDEEEDGEDDEEEDDAGDDDDDDDDEGDDDGDDDEDEPKTKRKSSRK